MKPILFHTEKKIILASASPRRQTFLRELGLQFTVIPSSIEELPFPRESATDFVQRMATEKARSIAEIHPQSFVLAADTIISFQGEILGKPKNTADALHILEKLQGTTHEVITSLSLCCIKEVLSTTLIKTTAVTFGTFSRATLVAYIQSGEPMDKAGAYAIQGQGGFLIKEINGSCSNVIGLPMHDLVTLLLAHKVISCKPSLSE